MLCQSFVSQVQRWGFQEWSFRISHIKNQKYSQPSTNKGCQKNVFVNVKVKINLSVCYLWRNMGSVEVTLHSFFKASIQCSHMQAITKVPKCTEPEVNPPYAYKAVPLQAWSNPEGSRKLRFPDYVTVAQDGSKVVSLTHRPPLPPGNAPGTHFC